MNNAWDAAEHDSAFGFRALAELGLANIEVPRNRVPTIGQQAGALEAAGFRVEWACWFRRPPRFP